MAKTQPTTGFGTSQPSYFKLDNYSKYFNVTTEEVVQRVMSVVTMRESFLEDLAGRLDLYGPAWIAITLAVAIFMVSTSGNFFPHLGKPTDLHSLSSALCLLSCHLLIVCFGGWTVLKWLGADSLHATELTTLVGYSLLLFYPILVGLGGLFSFRRWLCFRFGS
ncbi:Protein YIPF [Paramicrosporidium saccamoebae]|uniref:Protein YIPF n=1 Tax=Paramicrosporidium saccamoebae TaxID=1246581 RepID=A0A2H9TIY4_9FUNG|nr:Protein YIPF [Paramicrosporidium saccamoebae]